jgi:hypothetical protein
MGQNLPGPSIPGARPAQLVRVAPTCGPQPSAGLRTRQIHPLALVCGAHPPDPSSSSCESVQVDRRNPRAGISLLLRSDFLAPYKARPNRHGVLVGSAIDLAEGCETGEENRAAAAAAVNSRTSRPFGPSLWSGIYIGVCRMVRALPRAAWVVGSNGIACRSSVNASGPHSSIGQCVPLLETRY